MEKNELVARVRQVAETAFSVLGIAALLVSLIGLFVPQHVVAHLTSIGWILCGGAAVALMAYMALIALGELSERR
jgi:hypothetical protein